MSSSKRKQIDSRLPAGFSFVRKTGDGHDLYRHENGEHISIPGTPEEGRTVKNVLAEANRKARLGDARKQAFLTMLRTVYDVPWGTSKVVDATMTWLVMEFNRTHADLAWPSVERGCAVVRAYDFVEIVRPHGSTKGRGSDQVRITVPQDPDVSFVDEVLAKYADVEPEEQTVTYEDGAVVAVGDPEPELGALAAQILDVVRSEIVATSVEQRLAADALSHALGCLGQIEREIESARTSIQSALEMLR